MKVLLIILGVLALLIILLLSLSAEFTVIFDNGWSTKVRVLFYEKDIKLSELLSFVLFPDKAGKEAADKSKEKSKKKKAEKEKTAESTDVPESAERADSASDAETETTDKAEESAEAEKSSAAQPQAASAPDKQDDAAAAEEKEAAPAKKNPVQKILDEDGIAGLMSFVSNLLQTLHSAISTFMKGLHIYSLYVKMIIGGGDAADIAEKYGAVCGWYYPLKGYILNQMRVDQYDDYIQADFIAPRSEYEFQFIGSLSIGLLLKVLLRAGKTFLVNYFKNK